MSLRVGIISTSRADEGIYMPLVKATAHHDLDLTVSNHLLANQMPDWVVVLGDTWPMLDATLEAVKLNIPVAHIHGGDRSGGIDESIRHAITRFAHLHFPATQEHADRLLKMGEESWRIAVVGPLGIYAMPEAEFMTKAQVCKTLGIIENKPIVIVLQHPVLFQQKQAGEQMRATLDAVKGLDVMPIVIYPNGDPGFEDMIRVIERSPFKRFNNLPYLTFVSLLKHSACIVGNSSCGLVEAPLFSVPCVNVGTRQSDRTRDIYNSVNVGYDSQEIRQQVENALTGCPSTSINPYLGYQGGVETIIETLKRTPVNERLLQKRLTY